MKFRNFGRMFLALAVSLGTGLGVTSCSTNHTVAYMYVTGNQYNQISGFKVDNNLGNLTPTLKSPYPSGGVNPVRAVITSAGKFLYVLNAGCGNPGQAACQSGSPATANIALFTIGGKGSLTFQASYASQGTNPISMLVDSLGSHLYVLDSIVPDATTCLGYIPGNSSTICGDITAFNIDDNTGRLSLITNQQVKDSAGTNLTYFPIGSGPINFTNYGGSYLYTIENGAGTNADPSQAVFVYQFNSTGNGQLTLTQNTPIPSNAVQLTNIYASASYIYLLDSETPPGQAPTTPGRILPYTAGTNGALQSLVGGAVLNTGTTALPLNMIVDHTNKFVYIANAGPNLTPTSPASTVSAFFITPSTGLLQPLATGANGNSVAFGSGSSPRCILEDPSNQYLYTANYDSSTITGAIVNQSAGTLTNLRKNSSFDTVGQPTWCVASGVLF